MSWLSELFKRPRVRSAVDVIRDEARAVVTEKLTSLQEVAQVDIDPATVAGIIADATGGRFGASAGEQQLIAEACRFAINEYRRRVGK